MVLISIRLSTQELNIGKIDSELGYAEIHVGNADIVSKYNFIIHSINVDEINSLISQFREILNSLNITEYKNLCEDELKEIEKMTKIFLPARH